MNVLGSGSFWAFVGVVAGIYTILALGLQVQFGFAGLLNFGQVAFMAIGAYTMAILVVKEGWSMWLAAPLGIAAASVGGLVLGLPTLRLRADYFAIVTIAFSEIIRYVATNENSLTGGSRKGRSPWVASGRRPNTTSSGAASRLACSTHSGSRLPTPRCSSSSGPSPSSCSR